MTWLKALGELGAARNKRRVWFLGIRPPLRNGVERGLKTLLKNIRSKSILFSIKVNHANWLDARSREVNYVWNFCNEYSMEVLKRERRFVSGFDFRKERPVEAGG